MLKNLINYLFAATEFDTKAGVTTLKSDVIESAECCGGCWGGGI